MRLKVWRAARNHLITINHKFNFFCCWNSWNMNSSIILVLPVSCAVSAYYALCCCSHSVTKPSTNIYIWFRCWNMFHQYVSHKKSRTNESECKVHKTFTLVYAVSAQFINWRFFFHRIKSKLIFAWKKGAAVWLRACWKSVK